MLLALLILPLAGTVIALYKLLCKFATFPIQCFSPFDKIIITAACETPPNNLLKQLKINGKMVVPIGKVVQKMTLFTRVSENKFEKKTFGDYRFVPMLKNKH